MKKTALFTSFFILFFAQKITAQQTCNCIANLDTTIKKTELNYAGYPDMLRKGQQPKYVAMVNRLRAMAANQSDPQKCFSIIKEYVVFSNDKHFDFEYSVTDSTKFEFAKLDESSFRKNFTSKKRDSIEGIWLNPDSSTKLAIYKIDATHYKGIILESKDTKLKPGLVYYTFTKDKRGFIFDRYDWMTPEFPVRQRGNVLYVWNFELWGKVYPQTMTSDEAALLQTWRNYSYGLDCRKLDDNNVLLAIGSFNRDDKIKQLIQRNDSLIRSAKNLIVDLRGNGGGNSGWTYLFPYFYTNPIDQGDTYMRLSADNNRANLPGIQSVFEDQSKDPRWVNSYTAEYFAAYKKAYDEIPTSKQTFYRFPSLRLYADTVLRKPEKVALIFDDLGGSSTEYFFFISRQSSKVRRYGERTLGMMDYMGASEQVQLPFKDYYLLIPDRKASWTDSKPTNQTGFIPEHDLRHIPRQQWVEYVIKDLERK